MSDSEGAERHGPVDSETDDEEEATAQEEWASGDDNPDRDVEGESGAGFGVHAALNICSLCIIDAHAIQILYITPVHLFSAHAVMVSYTHCRGVHPS